VRLKIGELHIMGYLQRDQDAFVAADKSFQRDPEFVISEGHGAVVKDVRGREFLDFSTPSAIVGHNHPRIVEAIKKQMGKLTHFGEGLAEPQLALAEAIKKLAPGSLKDGKLVLGTSGTDSVEFALKLVRYHTRKPVVMSYVGGHHGRTPGTLPFTADYSRSKLYHFPYVVESLYVPYPHCYRCILGHTYPDCSLACLEYIRHTFDQVVPPEAVAAILVEPLLSWSGFAKPPSEYLPKLKRLCEQYGMLYVDDEVYTGMGRTGRMFAIEHSDVEPDVICLGKPYGAGVTAAMQAM
jgi:4-aminobutyrate aminotransferase-like enzyme